MLDPFVNQIFNENATFRQKEVKGIYPGSNNLDNISRIRFLNEKNYMNKYVAIKNGNYENTTDCQVAPSSITQDSILYEYEILDKISNGM